MKQTTEKISRSIDAKMHFLRSKIAEFHKEEGVTLIELLAVVVILGIIAIIAIPTVTNAVARSKASSTLTTEGTIQTALERYVADHGQYPASLSKLNQQTFGDGNSYSASSNSSTDIASGGPYGPYLTTQFPQNDGWGNPIYYAPLANTTTYPLPTGALYSGYVLLSGDGNAITFTDATNHTDPTSSLTGFIYAAGGTDASNASIGYTPSVTGSTKTLPSALSADVNATSASNGASSTNYTHIPTFTSN